MVCGYITISITKYKQIKKNNIQGGGQWNLPGRQRKNECAEIPNTVILVIN